MTARARAPLLAALLSVVALLAASLVIEGRIEQAFRADLRASLETVQKATVRGLTSWAQSEQQAAGFWAARPEVRDSARALLASSRDRLALLDAPEQRALRRRLSDIHGEPEHVGYLLISPDGINLASAHDENVGARSIIAAQRWLFDRLLRGETALSHPTFSDVPSPDRSGRLARGEPTMFAVAPVRDNTGAVIALFAVRLWPAQRFLPLLREGRPRATGETYAFDADGRLLSDSRFNDELHAAGALPPDKPAMLRLSLRATPVGQPQSRAVEAAIRGEGGTDLDGYTDYRGVTVVGAWTWSRDLELGIVTEIDKVEAYRSFHTQQTFVHLLVALGSALMVGLAALSMWSRRRLELINEELERRVDERTRAAREASEAKSAFLARVSHEIRTPMNAILGVTYLILQTELRPGLRRQLSKVHDAARGLLAIINDILDLSKIEAGRMELEKTVFDVDQMLREIVGLTPERQEVELLLQVAPNVPRRVIGDPLRLRQVLVNLVDNALKFTERGEIVVAVERAAAPASGRVTLRFDVRDTGIGFDPSSAPRFFEAFVQGNSSTPRRPGGTGIGLAICKQLVGLMGGDIHAVSRPGEGSTFTFTLSLEEAPEEAPSSFTLEGKRALVVSRKESARDVLVQALEALGMKVTIASTGAEAREHFSSSGDARAHAFDVALVDSKTLKMDGADPATAIRGLASAAGGVQIPIVVLTSAYSGLELGAELERSPTIAIAQKPVTRSDLSDALAQVFLRAPRPGVEPRFAIPKTSLAGVRALVVEDNEISREVAAEMLRLAGADVALASNGAQAVERVGSEAFDVVLMDIQMPVMDGYEAVRRIRADPRHAALPILATTAEALPEQQTKCLEAGMNDHLAKPLDSAILAETVARWAIRRHPVTAKQAPERARAPREPPRDLPGFNTARALARLDENQSLLRRLREQFCRNHAKGGAEVREAWDKGDFARVRFLAHTLKGGAAAIGADALARASAALEDAAGEETEDRDIALLEALERALCDALEGLKLP